MIKILVEQRNSEQQLIVKEAQSKEDGEKYQDVSNDRYTECEQGIQPKFQYPQRYATP